MKRAFVVLLAVVVSFAAIAAVQRTLTPEEETAITAYFTARSATYAARNLNSERNRATRRRPDALCREYERCKMNYPDWRPGLPSQRWLQRPKFPGWDDPCYTWYPNGKSYQSQLFCTKCKGQVINRSGAICDGWVNPSGFTCSLNHPLPLMDQWRFTVRLIATDHKKPMEAKAHVWNAHEHGELTDAQYDELMGIIDAVEAEAKTKAESAPKTP